jgi:hypothetical protein
VTHVIPRKNNEIWVNFDIISPDDIKFRGRCYEIVRILLCFREFAGSYGSRDSSVGIALGYGLDNRGSGVRFPAVAGNFSLHHRVQNGSGAQPAFYSMGVKRPGREAEHSPSSSAKVRE